jgi:pimeloyl-ACP methyl ester carboxylesterase
MSFFALIHGSMHGGWCWTELIRELEVLGHEAVGPDLPCEDPSAGLAAYADAVEAHLGDHRDIVLVGHSLGGRTLPVLATRRSTARLIFLCCVPTALGPVDPAAFAGMVTDEFAAAELEERPDGTRRMLPASAEKVFFHDCSPAVARESARRLRFQGPLPLGEATPVERWPDTPLDIILTRDDRAVRAGWALEEAQHWLGGRSPKLLGGSHSPFLSRPAELARLLDRSVRAS